MNPCMAVVEPDPTGNLLLPASKKLGSVSNSNVNLIS